MNRSSHSTRVAPEAGGLRPSLVARLADEMATRWRAGDRPLAEEYLDRHPELRCQPDAALELVAEELILRHEYGRTITRTELVGRFPDWQPRVEALWQGPRVRRSADPPRLPEPGAEIGGFRLLHELGRGANGRVFLAAQSALAGRAVVLKLAPKAGDEHLSLARLQHSHIVPLYSAHEFPEYGLRGLCLPYFGRTTLDALLTGLSEQPGAQRTGAHVLAVLRAGENHSPVALPVGGPACEVIRRGSFVDAVCGIGASLADALGYAHSRGLVHLDVKPSNVLIAADGVPMLLDFHLARAPLAAADAPPAVLGGTPGYMAPEHTAAVDAVRRGHHIPGAVDGRADIYSLGVLLRDALAFTGSEARTRKECRSLTSRNTPVPPRATGSRATRAHGTGARTEFSGAYHPDVSPGLRDILARCTAPDPADRYPGATDLAADLRRHLANLPLRGVPNRSPRERWCKWRRRRPRALPGLLVGAALLCFVFGFAWHADRQVERATTALREGETRLHQGRYAESVETFRGGEAVLRGIPFTGSLGRGLHDGRLMAERGLAATELHQFCERVRPLYAAELVSSDDVRAASARCQAMWAQRQMIATNLEGQPTAALDRQWRADLLDLGILSAHLLARHAPRAESEAAHRQALAVLDDAEALLGPSGVLYRERAVHARAIGLHALAEDADRRAASRPPATAWEHLLAGRAFFAANDLARAGAEFDRCLELEPGSLWGNNYRGLCRLRLREPAGAAAAFSACVALAPETAWCYANRGLAQTESGRLDWAGDDFDRALALDPNSVSALMGRATVRSRSGRFADALTDLRAARAAGAPAATVHYHTAAVYLAAGDRPAAVAALRQCLDCDPAHPDALAALARLEPDR